MAEEPKTIHASNYYRHVHYSQINPTTALSELLAPITWNSSSSASARRALVTKRREEVAIVYPFLPPNGQDIADGWLEKERHDGLWD